MGRIHQTAKPGKGALMRPRDPIPFSHVIEGPVVVTTVGETMFIHDGVIRDVSIRIRNILQKKGEPAREVPKDLKDVPESLRAMITETGDGSGGPAKTTLTFEVEGIKETRTRNLDVKMGFHVPEDFEIRIEAGDILRIKLPQYAGVHGLAVAYTFAKGQK